MLLKKRGCNSRKGETGKSGGERISGRLVLFPDVKNGCEGYPIKHRKLTLGLGDVKQSLC
jgi:hypothetical protein